jgi:hypothetical protein
MRSPLGSITNRATSSLVIACALASTIVASACSSTDTAQRVRTLALGKYGNQCEITYSATRRFALCSRSDKERRAVHPVTFFVYDTERDSIIYERELESGTVQWLDATHLSITTIPGNITGDEDPDRFSEVYDVESGSTLRH